MPTQGGGMEIKMFGIEHVGIFSKDTERLKNWYAELFGWKTVYDNGKGTYFLKADDGTMIEFCKAEFEGVGFEEKTEGIRHIAVSVDDFNEAAARVKAAGVEIIHDAKVNEKGVGTMFFKDIDGNIIHLIYREAKL